MKIQLFRKLNNRIEKLENRVFEKKDKSEYGKSIFSLLYSGFYSYYTWSSLEEEIKELRRDVNLILVYLKVEVKHKQEDKFVIKKLSKNDQKN